MIYLGSRGSYILCWHVPLYLKEVEFEMFEMFLHAIRNQKCLFLETDLIWAWPVTRCTHKHKSRDFQPLDLPWQLRNHWIQLLAILIASFLGCETKVMLYFHKYQLDGLLQAFNNFVLQVLRLQVWK